jgi:hypothetical protein
VTYHWKILDEGYNFFFNFISIKGLHTKSCALKVVKDSTLGIPGHPLGNPGTKCHLDVGLVERLKVYYKGGGGGFPWVWAMVSLMSPKPFVTRLSTKNVPTKHWPTCCLVLCKFVWVNKCLSIFLVPSHSSNTPLYPLKMLQAKEHARTLDFSIVFIWDSPLNLSRNLGAHQL